MPTKISQPLRIAGVPEHFNLPWRERSWLHATQPDIYDPIHYLEAAAGTGAMTAQLANNEVDLAILLTEGAVRDIARGGRHRIIKVYVDTPLEWGVHVAANSDLTSIDDAKGKRYAISRKGSGSHIMAAVHAASLSWPTENLDFVQVDTLRGARKSLPAGEADVFFWEKTMTHPYVEAGEFRRIGVFQSPWPSFVVCASQSCLETKEDQVRALLNDINALSMRLQNNQDAAQLISNAYGITVDAASKWLGYTSWNTNLDLPFDTLQSVLDALTNLWPELREFGGSERLVHDLSE
ncbi:MAG: PhnD/SsuA/transferrin family substrate-binding protein [Gammaproteobacteria bacterium]